MIDRSVVKSLDWAGNNKQIFIDDEGHALRKRVKNIQWWFYWSLKIEFAQKSDTEKLSGAFC